MRTLTGSASNEINKRTSTEPVIIVEIQWSPTIKRKYADKDFQAAKGKILSIGDFTGGKRLKGGQSTSMGLVLDDSDGSILSITKQVDPHKATVIVYQAFEGLTASNNFILFTGKINSPVIWDEGSRTFQLTVVSDSEGREVGFSPESGLFDFVDPTIIGKPWPICFGDVIRVPAQRITPRIEATSLTRYRPITEEVLDALEQKVKKYTIMLAEVGLVDNALSIEDIQIVITNDDYILLLEDISLAFAEFTNIIEELSADRPELLVQLTTFVELIVEITRKEFAIDRINEYLEQLFEKLQILTDEAEDLQAAYETELDKSPFQDTAFVGELLNAVEQAQGAAGATSVLQGALIATIVSLSAEIVTAQTAKDVLVDAMTVFDLTEVYFHSNENFPQGPTELIINKQRFSGTITDNLFTILGQPQIHNLESVVIAIRVNDNPNEFWVEPRTDGQIPNIRNRYLLISSIENNNTIKRVIFITQQDGDHCYFSPLVYKEGDPIGDDPDDQRRTYGFKLFGPLDVIQEQASIYLKNKWETQLIVPGLKTPVPLFVNGLYQLLVADWSLEVGDKISFGTDLNEVYIANLYESTLVHEVMAYKNEDGQRILVPLPLHYYTVDLAFAIAGFTTTAITLQRPLSDYEGENWEDQIYVTLSSSLSNNTADVIEWITETWTDMNIDSGSFASVASDITLFPSNFALLTKQDSILLIEEIAWQARCAVWIVNDIVYIKYLSKEPDIDVTVNESDILATTLNITLTDTEAIVTVLEGEWRGDYAVTEPNTIILRNNVPIYGVHKEKHEFYIYNVEEYVQRSMLFWLIRKSNTWKIVNFTGMLNLLDVEVFDTLRFSLTNNHFSNSAVKSVVESVQYDSENHKLTFSCWLPIRSGFMVEYPFAWMSSAPQNLQYPTGDDPHAGGG